LVTNAPVELMTPEEAVVLYRARCKWSCCSTLESQDLVAVLRGSTVARQWWESGRVCWRRWCKLGWWSPASGRPTKSLVKVARPSEIFVGRIAPAWIGRRNWAHVLADLAAVLAKTCKRNKRSKPELRLLTMSASWTRLNLMPMGGVTMTPACHVSHRVLTGHPSQNDPVSVFLARVPHDRSYRKPQTASCLSMNPSRPVLCGTRAEQRLCAGKLSMNCLFFGEAKAFN